MAPGRRVAVLSALPALHDIIRAAFGWSESHGFEFAIAERVFRLKTLVEIRTSAGQGS